MRYLEDEEKKYGKVSGEESMLNSIINLEHKLSESVLLCRIKQKTIDEQELKIAAIQFDVLQFLSELNKCKTMDQKEHAERVFYESRKSRGVLP